MNCQEALNLLYDIIDKEASEIDTQQVQEHLSRCRHCSDIYRVEKSVNQLIKAKLGGDEPAPQIDVLKARVLGELDAIDDKLHFHDTPHREASPSPRPPSFRLGRYLAVAAALVVVVGTVYYGSKLIHHQRVFVPLERAHWSAEEHLDEFRNDATTSTMISSLDNDLDYVLEPQVRNFQMIGGRWEEIDGVKLMHFVYHNGNRIVSVFVSSDGSLTIPPELRDAAVDRHGITFFDHNCRGCRLVYHQFGNAVVVTATTDHDVELLDFVPGHRVI